MRWIGLVMAALLVPGCGAPPGATDRFVIEGSSYARTFEIARDVLRANRFLPSRVDARAGVMATKPKSTAGLATPWNLEQTSLTEELSDLVNDHRRRVRVSFTPVRDPGAGGEDPLGAPVPDVRRVEGPIEVRVQAFVERIRHPGRRLEPAKIDLSSRTADLAMRRRGVEPTHVQTLRRDDDLARRLAHAIRRRLERSEGAGGDP